MFDGSYQDFLDTVGWEMDEKLTKPSAAAKLAPAPVAKPAPPPRPSAPVDRKANRQARAKLVQERSRKLAPLEKRVAELEARIGALERERDETFRLLSDASAAGNATAIAELSKKSREVGPKIDAAYEQLESATRDLERETRAFDEREQDAG
jgi:ATP-binding cassette subfamily F protein 3